MQPDARLAIPISLNHGIADGLEHPDEIDFRSREPTGGQIFRTGRAGDSAGKIQGAGRNRFISTERAGAAHAAGDPQLAELIASVPSQVPDIALSGHRRRCSDSDRRESPRIASSAPTPPIAAFAGEPRVEVDLDGVIDEPVEVFERAPNRAKLVDRLSL